MKVLDKFVLKSFLQLFILVILTFIFIFIIVDLIEKIDIYIKNQLTVKMVLFYYAYQLPFFISIALPMSLLIATVFSISFMKKNNELSAIKSAGISMYRVSLPILILGLMFTIFSFLFEDHVVIPANRKRIEIERNELKRSKYRKKNILTDLSFQDSENCNIFIKWYNVEACYGKEISIQYFEENRLLKRIDSKLLHWDNERQNWRIKNYVYRELDSEGQPIVAKTGTDSLIKLSIKPADVKYMTLDPEGMKINELRRFIKKIKSSGNDTTRWEVNLHYKYAFPLTCFLVILIGIPISVYRPRKDIAFGAGFSLLAIFIYYGLIKFGQSLGYHKVLSPFLSVWIANLIYLFAGGYMFYKIRQ